MTSFSESVQVLEKNDVAVIGVPLDENSSYLRGPALAPLHIRDRLHCGSANLCAENGINLEGSQQWHDLGDIVFSPKGLPFETIESTIDKILDSGARVLSLGGDHSITYPILRAYAKKYKPLTILHFDAHPDIHDEFDGNPHSHASPFARIMESQLVQRLIQVGIRTISPHQREQIQRFQVETIEMRDWKPDLSLNLEGPLYLSFDMDALDPAYAPGVSHHEPGGLSTREVLRIIQSIEVPIVGADIVELNPQRDTNDMTAMVSAKILKEILAQMLLSIS